MIFHLVTDGRRLAASDDPRVVGERLVRQARDAADAGIDMFQLRESWLSGHDLLAMAADIVAATDRTPLRVLVNDRVDVALAAGAAGVHLKSGSMMPETVRRIVPESFVIGRSVHTVEEVLATTGAVDYLIAGAVWPTPLKPSSHTWLGIGGLEQIVKVAAVPVLAIGGVTTDRVPLALAAGAAGIAAIGLFSARGDGDQSASLKELVAQIRQGFDTSEPQP